MKQEYIPLFSGIELRYLSITDQHFPFPQKQSSQHTIIINYCRNGRIGWKTEHGNYIYLGAGDFSKS